MLSCASSSSTCLASSFSACCSGKASWSIFANAAAFSASSAVASVSSTLFSARAICLALAASLVSAFSLNEFLKLLLDFSFHLFLNCSQPLPSFCFRTGFNRLPNASANFLPPIVNFNVPNCVSNVLPFSTCWYSWVYFAISACVCAKAASANLPTWTFWKVCDIL